MSITRPGEREIRRIAAIACLMGLTLLTHGSAQAGFTALGEVSKLKINGGTPDGRFIVGRYEDLSGNRMAFRWDTRVGGLPESIGELPTGAVESEAFAVSEDAGVVVGDSKVEDPNDPNRDVKEALLWRRGASAGLGFLEVPCGKYESTARGVSDDGLAVAGTSRVTDPTDPAKTVKAAFRWEGGEMISLGFLAEDGNDYESQARGLSGNGLVVVGLSKNTDPNKPDKSVKEAFRWQDGAMVGLGFLSGDTSKVESEATATSFDGSWVVGNSKVDDPADPEKSVKQAFLWSEALGMQPLGFLGSEGGKKKPKYESKATGIADDGSMVVGESHSAEGKVAFVWTADDGMRSLKEVLSSEHSEVDLSEWVFDGPVQISYNGAVIAGMATNPDGNDEAFVATVPEPQGGLLAGLVLLAWLGRRHLRAS